MIVIPARVDLGVLAPGQAGRGKIEFRNAGDAPIVVSRVKTSCECVTVAPNSFQVDAKSSVTLDVQYDPAHDAAFRGGLGVVLTGEDSVGEPLFRATVDLSVQDVNGPEARR